ncbi:MAG: hypothetical protein AB8E15_10935 [Bdellovibrionales bacterium]
MSRQLDPRLFGGESIDAMELIPDSKVPQLDKLPSDPNLIRVKENRKNNIEMKVEGMESKVSESMRQMGTDLNQMTKRIERMETHYKTTYQSFQQKLSQLEMRVTDRNMMESKLNALVERQQQMVNSFETRMKEMRKLMEEKEMHNLKLNAALRDARNDLQRLKKT